MKSIKPGRGPSGMSAIGSVIAVIFGIFWTISAVSMGASGFFPLFGILFIIIGIVQAVYHFKNATGKNRYSAFDITDEGEERDPLQDRLFPNENTSQPNHGTEESAKFCPYCGASVDKEYEYCPKCGKMLP